ncbi:hypothetical protein MU1_27680 [Paenibacillus glycanilyticus]|uniref:Uncharacterized protein n=1 Tax=Paenibacillus glycanilyticus TaxID=126569 RepID=A0ABQ6GDU5_9BACL|nr:hypothetical protein MU1_27680 [Paenibacillus glycanilyticus]
MNKHTYITFKIKIEIYKFQFDRFGNTTSMAEAKSFDRGDERDVSHQAFHHTGRESN